MGLEPDVRRSEANFDVRCEWGENGIRELLPGSEVVIIVDVFSFTTSVDVAVSRGVEVFPFQWGEDTAAAGFAEEMEAVPASPRAGIGPDHKRRRLRWKGGNLRGVSSRKSL